MCYENIKNVFDLRDIYPKSKTSGNSYIYTLRDCLKTEIVYVGQTGNLMTRYRAHLSGQFRPEYMIDWVNQLSCYPVMNLLLICPTPFVRIAEHIAYNHLQDIGCNLINKQKIIKNMNSQEVTKIRKMLNESQTKFAERIGKSLRQVQYYEAGEIDIPVHVEKLLGFILKEQKIKEITK